MSMGMVMNRDPMRILAWTFVGLGAAVWFFMIATLPLRVANYEKAVETYGEWAVIRHMATPAGAMLIGFVVGTIPFGFGILLLAIRRPTPRTRRQETEQEKAREAVASAPTVSGSPYPRAKAWKRPPWERP
jgi:hypothetical protein